MRKVLLYGLLICGFTACKNVATYQPNLKKGILSLFQKGETKITDSLHSNNREYFNFFLKDGFASKFGL
ncbi:hypothetical protein A9P82_03065 [Arachidicoccus ginsenosidimutans]|nr:hypothetical protein A9P82_03065 [Arachidicoccus sp. BS20]